METDNYSFACERYASEAGLVGGAESGTQILWFEFKCDYPFFRFLLDHFVKL